MKTKSFAIAIFLSLLFVTIIQVPLISQSSSRLEAMHRMREGDNHFRIGNFEQAELSYTSAIMADVTYADAYMKRAVLYKVTMRYQEYERDYNTAISLNPYSEYIFNEHSKLEMISTDYIGSVDPVLEDENIINDKYDKDSEDLDKEIESLIQLEQYEKALANIDTLLADGYEVEYEFLKQGIVYFLMGDYTSARSSLDSVQNLNSNSSMAYDILGVIELKSENYNQAKNYFDQAIELNPDFSLAYYNRALANRFLGNKEAAIEDLNRAIVNSRDLSHVYFARAIVRKETGDIKGALTDYSSALIEDKTYSDALFNRAFTFKLLGNYSSALQDAELILEYDDEKPEYWNLKGNILLLYGDYDPAIEAFTRAIDLNSEFWDAYYNRGLAYLMSYRETQGCEDLSTCIDNGFLKAEEPFKYFCGKF